MRINRPLAVFLADAISNFIQTYGKATAKAPPPLPARVFGANESAPLR